MIKADREGLLGLVVGGLILVAIVVSYIVEGILH